MARPLSRTTWLAGLAGAVVLFGLAGCGGSAGAVATGGVGFTVQWPESNRLVPAASNSIQVEVLLGGTVAPAFTTVLTRPTTSARINGVPLGAATLRATAFPSNDASGTAQATGTLAINVVAGYRDYGTLTMASTITALAITPNPATVVAGSNLTLTATATNSNGQPVTLGSSSAITWSITAGGSNLSRDSSTGSTTQVTGVAAGTATVQAVEVESGVSTTQTVTITGNTGDVGIIVN